MSMRVTSVGTPKFARISLRRGDPLASSRGSASERGLREMMGGPSVIGLVLFPMKPRSQQCYGAPDHAKGAYPGGLGLRLSRRAPLAREPCTCTRMRECAREHVHQQRFLLASCRPTAVRRRG